MKHYTLRFIFVVVCVSVTTASFVHYANRVKRWNASNYRALEIMMEE